MSRLHDWVDWLGGLPFEVASAPAVLAFYKQRRFRLENLGLSDGHGCNEFVFSRSGTMPPLPLREPAKDCALIACLDGSQTFMMQHRCRAGARHPRRAGGWC